MTVRGNAGPFAATEATGGTIAIEGDAGDRAGGAVYGRMAGLDGATLVIRGRAGERLGDRMRSGLIVADAAGDFAGSRMIAGTIVAGNGGSLLRLSDAPRHAFDPRARRGRSELRRDRRASALVARLLERALRPLAPHLADLARGEHRRRAGDLATLGKGELLTPAG